jgi:hypothetical protein
MSERTINFDCTCREPRDGELVRVHPSPEMRREMSLVDVDGVPHLVADNMIAEVERVAPGKLKKVMMFTAQNMEGEIFLWPVVMPVPSDHPAFQAIDHWMARGHPGDRSLIDQLEHLFKQKTKH